MAASRFFHPHTLSIKSFESSFSSTFKFYSVYYETRIYYHLFNLLSEKTKHKRINQILESLESPSNDPMIIFQLNRGFE